MTDHSATDTDDISSATGATGLRPATEGGDASPSVFDPVDLGPYRLPHRIAMAPMTRSRAAAGHVPDDATARYYTQRASAALIISEATQISPRGVGYPDTPGIHSAEQVRAWKGVVDRVHRSAGRIYLQLWHVGRVSHPMYHAGSRPVAPSAVRPEGQVYTAEGMKPFEEPRALGTDEVGEVVERYRKGAENALEAGFDGVELHGANGYLVDQFLRTGTNRRSDRWGGSLDNRLRFLAEVTEGLTDVWGPERVGVRLSPLSRFNDMDDQNPAETFTAATRLLSELGVGYLHVVEQDNYADDPRSFDLGALRDAFDGPYMANGDYDFQSAQEILAQGRADLVSFGRLFLANPDLPRRFAEGSDLNEPDPATFYGGGTEGYTDYPVLEEVAAD